MALPQKFNVRLHESNWQGQVSVATGIYDQAAAAVPALLGLNLPLDFEIWSSIPQIADKRFNFRVTRNEFGQLVVLTLVHAKVTD